MPGGPTIDTHLAALPAVRLIYDVVRVGMSNNLATERLSYMTCALAKGVVAATIVDPLAAYNVLFGLVGTPAQMTEFGQRKTLLDYDATKDVQNAISAFGGSSDEREARERPRLPGGALPCGSSA